MPPSHTLLTWSCGGLALRLWGNFTARGPGSRPGPSTSSVESGAWAAHSLLCVSQDGDITLTTQQGGDVGVREPFLRNTHSLFLPFFLISRLFIEVDTVSPFLGVLGVWSCWPQFPHLLWEDTSQEPGFGHMCQCMAVLMLLVSSPLSPVPSRCRSGCLCPPHPISKGSECLLSWAWGPRGARPRPALKVYVYGLGLCPSGT